DTLVSIRKTVNAGQNLRALRARMNELVKMPSFLGTAHQGIYYTAILPLQATLKRVCELIALPNMPDSCATWLLEHDTEQRLGQLRDATGKLKDAIEAWRSNAERLASFATINTTAPLAAANQTRTALEVVTAFDEAVKSVTMLPQWGDY